MLIVVERRETFHYYYPMGVHPPGDLTVTFDSSLDLLCQNIVFFKLRLGSFKIRCLQNDNIGSRGAIVTVVVNGQNVRLLLSRIVLKFRYGSTMCLF